MANPTLPVDQLGTVTWVDDSNNWRAEDIHFLQARSVVRLADPDGDASSETPSHEVVGAVAYDTDDDELQVYSGNWESIPSAVGLTASGGVGGADIAIYHSGSAAITIASDGDVTVGDLTATSANITTLNVGSTALTYGSSVLNTDTGITATGTITGSTLASTGNVTGTDITGTGTVEGDTITATTTANLAAADADSLTVDTVDANTHVYAPHLATSASGLRLIGDRIQHGSDTDVFLDLNAWTLNDGSTNSASVAGVVAQNTEPTGDYPEGTIWIQTP